MSWCLGFWARPVSATPRDKRWSERARILRQYILAMAHHGGGAHIAPAYSMVEFLTVLFDTHVDLKTYSTEPNPEQNRFVLSKGHGCAALYASLCLAGRIKAHDLRTYSRLGGILGGHPDLHQIPGIEASTGSLGHGFLFAGGLAYANKLRGGLGKVFVVLGDGEIQEGSIWELALSAPNFGLDRLVAIIDYNKYQGMGRVEEISSLEPLATKWRSFGWNVIEIDGHDFGEIANAYEQAMASSKPTTIVAHTIKGKGVSFMEGKTIWHYRLPKGEEMMKACRELGIECPIEQVLA